MLKASGLNLFPGIQVNHFQPPTILKLLCRHGICRWWTVRSIYVPSLRILPDFSPPINFLGSCIHDCNPSLRALVSIYLCPMVFGHLILETTLVKWTVLAGKPFELLAIFIISHVFFTLTLKHFGTNHASQLTQPGSWHALSVDKERQQAGGLGNSSSKSSESGSAGGWCWWGWGRTQTESSKAASLQRLWTMVSTVGTTMYVIAHWVQYPETWHHSGLCAETCPPSTWFHAGKTQAMHLQDRMDTQSRVAVVQRCLRLQARSRQMVEHDCFFRIRWTLFASHVRGSTYTSTFWYLDFAYIETKQFLQLVWFGWHADFSPINVGCNQLSWLDTTSRGYTQTTTAPFNSGEPGCRNIRAGGDTANPPSMTSEECWYATYVVYRSFKHPPPIPKRGATVVARAGGWSFSHLAIEQASINRSLGFGENVFFVMPVALHSPALLSTVFRS